MLIDSRIHNDSIKKKKPNSYYCVSRAHYINPFKICVIVILYRILEKEYEKKVVSSTRTGAQSQFYDYYRDESTVLLLAKLEFIYNLNA